MVGWLVFEFSYLLANRRTQIESAVGSLLLAFELALCSYVERGVAEST